MIVTTRRVSNVLAILSIALCSCTDTEQQAQIERQRQLEAQRTSQSVPAQAPSPEPEAPTKEVAVVYIFTSSTEKTPIKCGIVDLTNYQIENCGMRFECEDGNSYFCQTGVHVQAQ